MDVAVDDTTAGATGAIDRALFVTLVVAGLSAAAGGIHGGVWPEHQREHWAFGAFFAASAGFQIGWSFAALRRVSRRLLRVGAIVNAALVAVWLATRTLGPPFGPHPWTREPVGLVDSITVALELALVVMCLRLSRPGAIAALRGRATPLPYVIASMAAGAVAIVGLAAAPSGGHGEALGFADHARHFLIVAAGMSATYSISLLRRGWAVRRG